MKVPLVLTLAGLGAAAPAVITKIGDVGSLAQPVEATSLSLCFKWFTQCDCPHPGQIVCFTRRAASGHVEAAPESSDNKVEVATKTSHGIRLPLLPTTSAATRPSLPPWNCVPEDVVCLWRARRTQATADAESLDDEVEVSVGPGSTHTDAPTTTRTATITSTKASSVTSIQTTVKAATSATPVDSSDDEAEPSLDADLEEFQTIPSYSRIAQQEDTPYPYALVVEDQNKTAIHQSIDTYLHNEYDAYACAAHCNEHRACDAFAIYIEREPSCNDCLNPETVEVNKCDLYNTRLQGPDVRKESQKQDVQGKTITRAVRAYNGYNRIEETATVTATRTRTRTVTVRESGSTEVSIAYRTHTVTTTAPPATTTVHHTMSPDRNITVTSSAPASTHTVTSTKSTATVTKTSTKSGSASPTTVTKTLTKSTAAVTKVSTKSTATVTKTSTKSVSASPTTRTVTSTKSGSASPATRTVTSTQSRTVVISASADTVASTKTRTSAAMFTTTKSA